MVVCTRRSRRATHLAVSGGRSGGQGRAARSRVDPQLTSQRSGAAGDIGWKSRRRTARNALRNPHAHLRIADIS